ncbi:hypothetical protein FQN57_001331 [Myotisia sp. PD_48]|nr:hypothetical protein FQN57_001331 [Myotisia sp. PD_48]
MAVRPAEKSEFLAENNPVGISMAVVVFLSLAMSNSIELQTLIFITFKRYRGLYFWSLVISGLAVLAQSAFFTVFYFQAIQPVVGFSLIGVSWATMVTGQSIVLYSRLHLVVRSFTVLRWVLIMIIFNAVVFHGSAIVLGLGRIIPSKKQHVFHTVHEITERVQMTGFTIQELVLSGLYLYHAFRLLVIAADHKRRRIVYELLAINVIIIVMDIALLTIIYLELWILQATLKPLVYSIKLKLEFWVLRKLIEVVKDRTNPVFPSGTQATRIGSSPPPRGSSDLIEPNSISLKDRLFRHGSARYQDKSKSWPEWKPSSG